MHIVRTNLTLVSQPYWKVEERRSANMKHVRLLSPHFQSQRAITTAKLLWRYDGLSKYLEVCKLGKYS